jgi:putative endonuclease
VLLIAKSYWIAARRWKTLLGEIDRGGGAGRSQGTRARREAAEAVTERSKQRIIAAAGVWLAHHPGDAQRDIRFEIMLVAPGKIPQHMVVLSKQAAELGMA